MDNMQFILYVLVMSGSTYLIRAVPFALISGKIGNRFIRSFLSYIPYAVLSAMTIPAIFEATDYVISASFGLVTALFAAYKGKSLTFVAAAACIVVFLTEQLCMMCGIPLI